MRTPPTDRPFWADDGYGEVVRVRFNGHESGIAPWPMFDRCDQDDRPIQDGDTPMIGADEIADWDEDRDSLLARI